MLPSEIIIDDVDISWAGKVLLPPGKVFDADAVRYIKSLGSRDLCAVPGSGKTTALLAKLLVLGRKMPFSDGSGLLVLSHTNAAVDEIKRRIEDVAPHLFSYPNFIGTIQGFVDSFLAIPAFTNEFGRTPNSIDFDIYKRSILSKFYSKAGYAARGYIFKRNGDVKENAEKFVLNVRFGTGRKLVGKMSDREVPIFGEGTATYKALKAIKESVLAGGVLCYDDAYSLSFDYIEKYPACVRYLRKRFQLVFVDEMQDSEQHQQDILDKVFDGGADIVAFQRVGDPNQSIYSHAVHAETIWEPQNPLLLNVSYRLSPSVAQIVQGFAVRGPVKIDAKNASAIKPIILSYSARTEEAVIKKFTEIISEKKALLPDLVRYPCRVVGWVAQKDPQRTTVNTYWPEYNANVKNIHKERFLTLRDALWSSCLDSRKNGEIYSIVKNIEAALALVAELEGVVLDGAVPTRSRILAYLRNDKAKGSAEFLIRRYQLANQLYGGYSESVCSETAACITKCVKEVFLRELACSKDYLDGPLCLGDVPPGEVAAQSPSVPNVYEHGGVKVSIGTVHSVKGETHAATLYLATSYQGGVEIEKIFDAFVGKTMKSEKLGVYNKERMKIAYVAMSRPTHLLCFACRGEHLKDVAALQANGWDIVSVA
jgi:hypothetical protein